MRNLRGIGLLSVPRGLDSAGGSDLYRQGAADDFQSVIDFHVPGYLEFRLPALTPRRAAGTIPLRGGLRSMKFEYLKKDSRPEYHL
jgi:hypothetical protein